MRSVYFFILPRNPPLNGLTKHSSCSRRPYMQVGRCVIFHLINMMCSISADSGGGLRGWRPHSGATAPAVTGAPRRRGCQRRQAPLAGQKIRRYWLMLKDAVCFLNASPYRHTLASDCWLSVCCLWSVVCRYLEATGKRQPLHPTEHQQ